MLIARLLCSDPQCAAELVAEGESLLELATLSCACGCGMEILAWPDQAPEPEPAGAKVIPLRRGGWLPDAA